MRKPHSPYPAVCVINSYVSRDASEMDPFSVRESCRNLLRCPHRCQFALAETRVGCINFSSLASPATRSGETDRCTKGVPSKVPLTPHLLADTVISSMQRSGSSKSPSQNQRAEISDSCPPPEGPFVSEYGDRLGASVADSEAS